MSGVSELSDQPLAPPVLRYVGAPLKAAGALLDGQDRVSFLAEELVVGFLYGSTHPEPIFLDCADVRHVVPAVGDCFPHSRPSIVADYTTVAFRYWPGCMCRVYHGILV